MDIDYLLLLQSFRNGINDCLTPFMEAISLFAVTYLVIIPAFVYWCVDKRSGLYTMASYNTSVAFNVVIKLSACIYRPWIRDARILPAGDAIRTATSYSFPSGHTTTAVPIYGGLAKSAWKKTRWISVLCVIMIALTCFSRNYLGVHTPQDVLVGIAVGVGVLIAMNAIFGYIDKNPEKENLFLLAGVVFSIAALIYITFKPYPMDYVDGKLLVDPMKMKKDGYGDIGMLLAFCVARFIEKTWVKFEPTMSKTNLAAGLVGAVITFFIIELLGEPMALLLGTNLGCLAEKSILILFIIAIWPAVMKAVTKNEKQ